MIKAAAERIDITTRECKTNDSLYAKVLLLQGSFATVALISLDYISLGGEICSIDDEFFTKLKRELSERGVLCVLCGTTHTHTPREMVTDQNDILQKISESVDRLLKNMTDVRVSYARGKNDDFIINRNIPTKTSDWTVRMAHALPHEDSYDSLSFADDSLRVLSFTKTNGEPLCVVFNFGCHPLVGFANDDATSNFPGIAEKLIEAQTGAMAMMFQSTGGDVCEVDYKNFFKPKDCSRHGIDLGNSVLEALARVEELDSEMLVAKTETEFPLRKDYDAELEKIRERQIAICSAMHGSPLNFKSFLPLYMKYLMCPEYPLDDKYVYLHEEQRGVTQLKDQDVINRRSIDRYLANIQSMEELSRLSAEYATLNWHKNRVEKLGDKVKAEITAIKVGDVIILSAPFEPLTSIGMKLCERFGEKVFLASYSNGYFHYGASADKYNTGAYETRECDLAPEWEEKYFEAVEKLVKDLSI